MHLTESQRLRIQNQVTAILAEAPGLDVATPRILEAIGLGLGWAWGSLWMLDVLRGDLGIQGFWAAPGFEAQRFMEASTELRFALGEGLPGLAWSEGRPQWLDDLSADPQFLRREAASQAGLRSGFAIPVRLQDQVLGVLAFFSHEHRVADAEFLDMMVSLGSQVGQFIERKKAEDTLRNNEARYRAVVEQAEDGIFLFDLESGVILESNPAFQRLLSYTPEELMTLTLFELIAHERESIRSNLQKIQEIGHFRIGERNYRRKDGGLVAVDVAISRISLPGGMTAVAIAHDLSDRRRLEGERNRLAEILEATTDFVGMADLEGHAIYGNLAMRNLRGLDSPELKRPLAEAHPPWAAKKILEEAIPAAMEAGVWRGETAFLDLRGQEIPISQLLIVHRDSAGRPAFLSTIARDISAEKTKARELQELVKRLEDLRYAVDESTIFAITDIRGVITDVNAHFCEVSGYSREEMLGKTHKLINSGFHSKAFFKDMWDTILSGRVWRGEFRNRAKDGSIYWVDATLVPWLDAHGKPERFISLRTVITERKRAEEALLQRERQLEILSQASRDLNQEVDARMVMQRLVETGVRLVESHGGDYGVVEEGRIWVRESMKDGQWIEQHLDFGPGEGIPGWILETQQPVLCHDASQDPRVSPVMWRHFGLQSFIAVPILGRKGGLLGYFAVHNKRSGLFDEGDRAMLESLATHAAVALGNIFRLEEKRRQEEALRHTQKLESLGLMAGGIAHDFNNLLSAILGNLSLAMMETPPASTATRHLQSIDRAVMRAADLTRQMLAYAGKGKFNVKRIDLNATVEEIARLLEASIPKKLHLDFRLHPGLPGLDADAAQVEQLILNLVTNAADAIGDREGTIRLATDSQHLMEADLRTLFPGQTLTPGLFLTLEVTDDGCGIEPDILARIFDPFFTTKTTGRGLGLSAMLGILRGHGGGIKIYSEPGLGSTFRIFLPGASDESVKVEAHPEALAWTGQGTVLVVDDDADVLAITCAQVASLGFQIIEARDGQEALDLYRTHADSIDLVLMDFSMPRLNGREALRAIRALNPRAPVILCSGFDEGGSQAHPGDALPTAFLQKPFRLSALSRVLREALSGAGEE